MFRYYIATIVLASLLIIGVNGIFFMNVFFPHTLAYLIVGVPLLVLAEIVIDAIVASISRLLPKKIYNPNLKIFTVSQKEKAFYNRIAIKKWKDKIPETGKLLVGFSKSSVVDTKDNEYLGKFLFETCIAEVMHVFSIPFGFLVIFLIPLNYAVHITLPIAIVNACLQILPVFIQRYNRSRLIKIYNHNQKKLLSK